MNKHTLLNNVMIKQNSRQIYNSLLRPRGSCDGCGMAWHRDSSCDRCGMAWPPHPIHRPCLRRFCHSFNQRTNESRKHHKLTNRNLRPHSIHSAVSQTHSRIHTHRPASNCVCAQKTFVTAIILRHPIGFRRARSLQQSPICLVDVSAFQGACVAPFWSLRIFPSFNCLVKSP